MHVVQTAGEPPYCGSTILAIIGWTRNRRAAPTNTVAANRPRRLRWLPGSGLTS
jgi:hypothetical protein